MARSRMLLFPLALAALAAAPARAGDPCRADAQRFCQGVPPGKGRILSCLKGREPDLAPACQAEFRAARERAAGFRKACGPDAERFCGDVRPGQGRVLACLKGREADLAPACRAELAR